MRDYGTYPLRIRWHLLIRRRRRSGHYIVTSYFTSIYPPPGRSVRGWVFECSCGKTWAYR